MKFKNRCGVVVITMIILGIGTLFSTGMGAQEEGWQIMRADYGFKNRRNDVTDILKDLIGRQGRGHQSNHGRRSRGRKREVLAHHGKEPQA